MIECEKCGCNLFTDDDYDNFDARHPPPETVQCKSCGMVSPISYSVEERWSLDEYIIVFVDRNLQRSTNS